MTEPLKPSVSPEWTCKARKSAVDPPQDCDWPRCDCDPYAEKVIAAIEESGYAIVPESRAIPDACKVCGARWSCGHEG